MSKLSDNYNPLYLDTLSTPVGVVVIIADPTAIHAISFDTSLCHGQYTHEKIPMIMLAEDQLNQYFNGKLIQFDLPLHIEGTPFQKQVWNTLNTIPYGTTWSYRELAEKAGTPKAWRAVANANGANPFPIVIPCHRVIRSNGDIGGYTSGNGIKHWLLDHECSK